MKPARPSRSPGFTLLETVIAIGVLSVLLSGFIVVFTPAADGIRKSLNLQQADRMASAVEEELVTLRGSTEMTDYKTGFNKSFYWVQDSNVVGTALVVYQYRGKVGGTLRADNTPEPVSSLKNMQPGKDYVVVPICRRVGDPLFANASTGDITAIEGGVYLVKCKQLLFSGGQLIPTTTPKTLKDPKTGALTATPDVYPEAVIAFNAEFYSMPVKTAGYFTSTSFTGKFDTLKNPVFTRNLAVRR